MVFEAQMFFFHLSCKLTKKIFYCDAVSLDVGRALSSRLEDLDLSKGLLRYWVFLSILEVVLGSRFLARLHFFPQIES